MCQCGYQSTVNYFMKTIVEITWLGGTDYVRTHGIARAQKLYLGLGKESVIFINWFCLMSERLHLVYIMFVIHCMSRSYAYLVTLGSKFFGN